LEGGQRHEAFTYPDEEWFYYVCADRFGWTPETVDEQPAARLDWILAIAALVKEVENDKHESQTRS
jgi:hypothetical protein